MKKKFLYCSVFATVIFSVLILLEEIIKSNFCGPRDITCWESYNLLMVILLLSPALLISSLISLKVSDTTFSAWKKITQYFIPAYLIIIILMPWSVGDEIAGFTKGMLGLVLCVGYTLFSCAYLLLKKK
ncbi:MAG: hypothetical protein KIH67_001530 [Candidatus Moranbacteria bacterium]|nr:hypothetical protein [Candidatus Moranbacteria bacterium]